MFKVQSVYLILKNKIILLAYDFFNHVKHLSVFVGSFMFGYYYYYYYLYLQYCNRSYHKYFFLCSFIFLILYILSQPRTFSIVNIFSTTLQEKRVQLQICSFILLGISSFANNPSNASHSLAPLLRFAAHHIPHKKHQETPLYILATAGMRILPKVKQNAILDNLKVNIPKMSEFYFTDSQVEVISGKQEGNYIYINISVCFERGRTNLKIFF